MDRPLSRASGFILTSISLANRPARYPSIGSISRVMVSAAYAIVLSSHFNGLHPRCYRASTAASVQAPPSVGRPLIDGPPGLSDVSTSHGRLRTSIPAGARDLWSKCLIHALASVVAHRDERSWVDLLTMLP